MERIKGEMIGIGWVNKRSEESKKRLLRQLRGMIEEMRSLPPPLLRSKDEMRIMAVDGGHLYDCRVPGTTLTFGPFRSVRNFHRHLRRGMEYDDRLDIKIRMLIKLHNHDDDRWPLVITHGDPSSLNTPVRGADVVGIIDWETAGWYPSYWEYTTACLVNPQILFWAHEIDKFLTPNRRSWRWRGLGRGLLGMFDDSFSCLRFS